MFSHRCAALVLMLGLSACASSTPTPFGEEAAAPRARGTPTLITRAQLEERGGDSAYQAVQRLNRRWLQPNRRGGAFSGQPQFARVVVDGTVRGGLIELELLSANDVEFIRYLSAPDATTKYGTGYPGGAVEVTTRGNRP